MQRLTHSDRIKGFRLFALAAVMAACAVAGNAAADPIPLKLATFGPPQSFFYVEVIIPWMEAVNRDAGGAVEIKYYGGSVIGNAGNMYDAVLSGAADIGWALQGVTASKFVKSSIVELPFGYTTGEFGAVAFWRLYQKGLIASDYDAVKLFGVTAWPAAAVQTRSRAVAKLEDLKGMKLRVSGKLQADTVLALGATPVNMPVDEIYQSIERGVIDGAWASLTGTREFRLFEIVQVLPRHPAQRRRRDADHEARDFRQAAAGRARRLREEFGRGVVARAGQVQ